MQSDNTAMPLKLNALVAKAIHTVCLNFTKKRRRYLMNHHRSLFQFLSAGAVELKVRIEDLEEEKSVSLFGIVPSDVLFLEDFFTAKILKRCVKKAQPDAGRSNVVFFEAG